MDLRLQADWAEYMARAALRRVHRRDPKHGQVLEAFLKMGAGDSEVLAEVLGERKERMAVMLYRARRMLAEELWNELNETVAHADVCDQEMHDLLPFLKDYLDPEATQSLRFFDS